jgi:hypothetical protein
MDRAVRKDPLRIVLISRPPLSSVYPICAALRLNPYAGCTLSHRTVVAEAEAAELRKRDGIRRRCPLYFRCNCWSADRSQRIARPPMETLLSGSMPLAKGLSTRGGSDSARAGRAVTCTHAVAYHESVYDRILSEVPGEDAGIEAWIKTHLCIDQ